MNSQTNNPDQLSCWIYKSSRKDEMYLYLSEEEGFDQIPDELRKTFGELIFVMELELSEERELARVDVSEVIKSLNDEGFFLQMPPKLDPDLYFGD